MEVSKAMTNIKPFIKENDTILDVGCASGHFYRSIKKGLKKLFILSRSCRNFSKKS